MTAVGVAGPERQADILRSAGRLPATHRDRDFRSTLTRQAAACKTRALTGRQAARREAIGHEAVRSIGPARHFGGRG